MYNHARGLLFWLAVFLFQSPPAIRPQQLLYESQQSLRSGARVGIFLPTVPIAVGLQSKSGPRVMTIGDLVSCRPFDETYTAYQKAANGEFEEFTGHKEFLNCGPLSPGGEDRIFAVVGIQWRQQ
jgi:hypothetical protein